MEDFEIECVNFLGWGRDYNKPIASATNEDLRFNSIVLYAGETKVFDLSVQEGRPVSGRNFFNYAGAAFANAMYDVRGDNADKYKIIQGETRSPDYGMNPMRDIHKINLDDLDNFTGALERQLKARAEE